MRFALHLPERKKALPVTLEPAGPAQRQERARRGGGRLAARHRRERDSARARENSRASAGASSCAANSPCDKGSALLVDDYGHHPRELAAVFAAARGGWPETAPRRRVPAASLHAYARPARRFRERPERSRRSRPDRSLSGGRVADRERGRARARARGTRARQGRSGADRASARAHSRCCRRCCATATCCCVMGAGDIGAAANELTETSLRPAKRKKGKKH